MYGERKRSYIGEFEVGDKLFVSDPCYSRVDETNRCSAVVDVIPGTWQSEVVVSDEGGWGVRVAELRAWHKEEGKPEYGYMNPWNVEHYANCGVDSGQLGFFDHKSYPIGVNGYEVNYDDPDNWYHQACNETHDEKVRSKLAGIVKEMGVNSSTGFGDGLYEIYVARNNHNQVVVVKAVFIPEDGDDHD